MPPKKREREIESQKPQRIDQIQADHELFLQAFEKPTQIYRFLRTRNQISPIFLNRNLTYMRQRMSRSHKSRRGFKLDSILKRIELKNNLDHNPAVQGYMTLTFLGFYDKKIEISPDPVKVETLLLNISHKKRKDVSSQIMPESIGISEVPINPSENQPPPKAPTISISNESFSLNNGIVAKTYMLILRVSYMSTNVCLMNNCDLDSEPAQKRRKSSPGGYKTGTEDVKIYGSELIVYDKHNRCLLTDGDYELGLQEVQPNNRSSPKKHSSWETISDIKDCGPFDIFSRGPTLKFRLSWTTEPINGFVDRPTLIHPLPNGDNKENRPGNHIDMERCATNIINNNNNNNNINNNNSSSSSSNNNNNISSNNNSNVTLPNASLLTPSKMSGLIDKMDTSDGTQQIVYQFLYNNNSRQQTEACEDLHCPWCSLDCGKLYALLKHLKLCHSRFTFTYVPIPQGARIDVAINECYDGSYAGSPHELISQPSGSAFSRTGPTRRTSVTNILVCRPKRPKPSLSEFLELDENEFESQRPYITGHNRLYHHTVTCLPIYPKELDNDSEGENDPKWLQTKTMMMIDDFTDVNEGEKELMKMWNLHVMKNGFVGDCQIPLACQMFVEYKGKELLMKNLYRNFVLHMNNLFDFNLISPVILYQTIQKLQEIMKDNGDDIRKILQKSHESQVENWLRNGVLINNDYHHKLINTSAKIHFNNEISNSNARRKTTLPLSSPPATQSSVKSIHNKHASMIATPSSKNTTSYTTTNVTPNKTTGINNPNNNIIINQSNVGVDESKDRQNDLPIRRKSTNSIVITTNNQPSRRKSITVDNNQSNELHRRKLVLDSVPSAGASSSNSNSISNNSSTHQKTSHLNDNF